MREKKEETFSPHPLLPTCQGLLRGWSFFCTSCLHTLNAQSALIGANNKVKGDPGYKTRSTGLSEWAVRLHLRATCWSLCRTVHSAVGGIRNKAKMIWTDVHKRQACVWVRMVHLCCSNKWPHDFNELQLQRFLFTHDAIPRWVCYDPGTISSL